LLFKINTRITIDYLAFDVLVLVNGGILDSLVPFLRRTSLVFVYHNTKTYLNFVNFEVPLFRKCVSPTQCISAHLYLLGSTRWRIWLWYCATSREVAVSVPDNVTGIFH
jgi:hypothetical protein